MCGLLSTAPGCLCSPVLCSFTFFDLFIARRGQGRPGEVVRNVYLKLEKAFNIILVFFFFFFLIYLLNAS